MWTYRGETGCKKYVSQYLLTPPKKS